MRLTYLYVYVYHANEACTLLNAKCSFSKFNFYVVKPVKDFFQFVSIPWESDWPLYCIFLSNKPQPIFAKLHIRFFCPVLVSTWFFANSAASIIWKKWNCLKFYLKNLKCAFRDKKNALSKLKTYLQLHFLFSLVKQSLAEIHHLFFKYFRDFILAKGREALTLWKDKRVISC